VGVFLFRDDERERVELRVRAGATIGERRSMSRRGNCWDNSVVGSFFATIKRELICRRSWPSRDEAKASMNEWIKNFYNRERSHSRRSWL
jgi:transposase InsO family protein